MKVLLTGANGFVGSHILDRLQAERISTRLLLRPTSDTRFIRQHLTTVEIAHGSVNEPASLATALEGITHVVHCAGKTKALRTEEYFEVNQHGTRNLVEAINQRGKSLHGLVVISSLAASRPAIAAAPAREDDPPAPVTPYGRSKLAGEQEVQAHCRVPYTILRPAAVYGPRDKDILVFVRCMCVPIRPRFGDERQELSLVYAPDVANATLAALRQPAATGRVYHLASPEVFTFAQVAAEIARQLNRPNRTLTLPAGGLWWICALQDLGSRLTGKPNILSREKYPELRALGWVCDTTRLARELGFVAGTPFAKGMAETLAWYRKEKWL